MNTKMAWTGPEGQKPPASAQRFADSAEPRRQSIPGSFQLLLSLYIIFTGSLPTLIQGLAFGLHGGASNQFAIAMITGIVINLLQLLPVLILANHPLGILHPIILALIVWPVVTHASSVIQDFGGWAGVFAGLPVAAPHYVGLPGYSATAVWTVVAKYNGLRIVGLICTYAGFWGFKGQTKLSRLSIPPMNPRAVRAVMLTIVAISLIVLILFIRYRGGINEHLTSLGRGRFVELAGFGPVLVITTFGAVAMYVWTAARPSDVKNPLFLTCLAAVTAAQFLGSATRSGALEVPLYVGLIWAFRRRNIPWKIALMLVPFMFVSIGLLGAMRSSAWYGSDASRTLSSASWSESMALTQQEINNREALSASVPVIERGYELSGGPLLGYSYAAAVTSIIPRAIWPDKPRGVGSLYARTFMGAAFSGTTIPVGPEAEMYWNFGIAGVVLLSLIYGVLLRRIYYFHWRHYPSPFAAVFYLLVVTRFQFSSDRLVGLEQQVGLVLLCYLAVAFLFPPQSNAATEAATRIAMQQRQAFGVRRS